jgi:hypothetical protein
MREPKAIVVGVACCALVSLSTVVRAQDPLPDEAAMFFNRNCPSGWEPYFEADGRLLVAMPTGAGSQVGNGVGVGGDPLHQHGYSASIELNSVEYVAVAACSNDCLSRADRFGFGGNTGSSTTGLPFVLLNICIKVDPAETGKVPSGMMSYFFRRRCPGGWRQVLPAQGRLLVGLPPGGAPEASFGGPPLAPNENRTHRHSFSGSVATRVQDIAAAPGCCAGGYGANGSYPYSGTSFESTSGMPYIQLLLCQKD